LAENPLPSHDVVFIFTGAAESLNAGIEAFITQYAPPQAESRWIVLDSVGVGTPVYVQRGGLSLLTTTRPGAHSAAAAAETARKRPELRINGCAITTVDESARLRAHGYDAVRIAAIDSTGQVPNWNRTDDTTSALNPDTLYRAAAYTRALIGTLTDARENAPA
jgi:Zn-dependent M28 family amino/carboxypeptidase